MPSLFLQLARKIINEENRPLAASEIWDLAQSKGYDKDISSKGKTPWATLGAMLYVDVRDNPDSWFVALDSRPKKFFIKSLVEKAGGKLPETASLIGHDIPLTVASKYLERDLHPFLAYYGYYYLKAYLKTIHHSKSKKATFGEWVHPDMVGCYFPFGEWKADVVDISALLGNTAVKLYSFEIKKELSFANLRESFFQAVSNSSWANEGYLVAAEISKDVDFRSELKRLCVSFGIGVIELDIEDPDSSQVIEPAHEKDQVDWETVNKLASMENGDFEEFLKRIKTDFQSREVRREKYDQVLEKEVLIQTIKK